MYLGHVHTVPETMVGTYQETYIDADFQTFGKHVRKHVEEKCITCSWQEIITAAMAGCVSCM